VIAASVLMIYKGPYLRLAAESRAVTTSSIDIDLTSF
jgi:hypothetical protein